MRTSTHVSAWLLIVPLAVFGCRKKSDTDESSDLGVVDIPDLVISGTQPVTGNPDTVLNTDDTGKTVKGLKPRGADDGADGVDGVTDGGGDPTAGVTWGSLIDDFSVAEDAAVNKTVVATELDGALVFTINAATSTCDDGSWSPNVSIDSSTGALSGSPTNDDVGSCDIALHVQGDNGFVEGIVHVTVTNTADMPTWLQEPIGLSVGDGRNLVGFVAAADVDAGASINYSLDLAAMNCDEGSWSPEIAINATTGALSGTPSPSDRGICTVVVRATSAGQTITSGPHDISVIDLPDAPTWTSTIGNQTVNEDAALSFFASATDTDVSPTIVYGFDLAGMTCDDGAFSPALAINSSTGEVTGTPTNDDVGSCTVKVVATSGVDSINQTFTLTVSNTNDVPTWNPAIADFSHVRDSMMSKTAIASDVDAGASITYSLDTAGMTCDNASPAWTTPISINSSTGVISGRPAFANIGTCTIRVRADSGGDSIYDDITLTIVDTSAPPTWDATITDRSINEDSGLSVSAAATDVDNSVSYSLDPVLTTCDDDASWSPSLAINSSSGAITGTPTNASVGVCNINVVASAGGIDITDLFQVTVVNTDDAPTWVQLIGNFSMNEDTTISKTASATDMDPSASITYSLDFANMTCDTQGWSPQISINASTGVLGGQPVNPGSCTVRVVATSSSVSINDNFTITINDTTRPTVVVTAAQTSPTNATTINYTVTFNESVAGTFDVSDVTVANGTKGNFAGSGAVYTFDVTSPTGTVTVNISANVAQDAAGNFNTAATQHSMATLSSITVDAALASIQVSNNQSYSANGVYSDSSTVDLTSSVTWTSTSTGVATMSSNVATGISAGTSNITATLGGVSGFKVLTVNAATLSSISITPVSPVSGIGGVLQFAATGTYSNGSTQDVTEAVNWTSGTPANVTINNTAGSKGSATAVATGTSVITAQQGAVSATRTMTVTAATVSRIEVTPYLSSGPVGVTQQFYATAVYTNNTFSDVTASAVWSSSDPTYMSISNASGSEGRATLIAARTGVTITATFGVDAGTATFEVLAPTLTSIAVTPANSNMPVGLSQQFKATGTFSDASTRDITADVSWTSTDATKATVSNAAGQKGFVTSVAAGTAAIRATHAGTGVNSQTNVNVTSATLTSVTVSPAYIMLTKLVGKQFTATATFSDSSSFNVTSVVNWTNTIPASGTMGNSNNDKGYFYNIHNTATTVQLTVTANLNGTTGTSNVVITQGVLTGIQINPLTASINVGSSQQFTAYGQYDDGASSDITEFVTWTSSAPAVAFPSNAPGNHGKMQALSTGSATITATLGGVSDTSALTVAAGAPAVTEEGVGLFASYYNGKNLDTLKGTRTDAQIDFYWGTGNSPLDVADTFSVRWTGFILIPSTGTYTLCTLSDDGVRLTFNSSMIINVWTDHAVREDCVTGLSLTGGTKYPVVMDFYENGGFAEIRLKWIKTAGGGTFAKQIIPRANLFPN